MFAFALVLGLCLAPIAVHGQCTGHHAKVTLEVSKAGLDMAMDTIRAQATQQVANLKIPDQKAPPKVINMGVCSLEMNVGVTNIKIKNFVPPTFSYVLSPPNTIKVVATGGAVEACFDWGFNTKCGIINVGPGGTACGSLEKSGVNIVVQAKMDVVNGKLTVDTSANCEVKVPLDFSFKGGFLPFPLSAGESLVLRGLVEGVEKMARGFISSKVCSFAQTTIKPQLEKLPTQFNLGQGMGMAYSICGVEVNDAGLKVSVAFNGTMLG